MDQNGELKYDDLTNIFLLTLHIHTPPKKNQVRSEKKSSSFCDKRTEERSRIKNKYTK